ncbi:MAG: SDR family NAD(P)-dependent oxidoreductase [Candidatus Dormibacteraeota bacterium]|nr:SDR family NAD(P)-dependent oxidoreductase [Candidatus Dormibacteraeota bacterium]
MGDRDDAGATAAGVPRVALITGGSSGIGLATAHRLGRDGFRLVLTGRDRPRGEAAVAGLVAQGVEAHFLVADSRDGSAAVTVVDFVDRTFGRLDLLVANAGVGVVAPLIDTPPEQLERLLAVNVLGYLIQVQAARALLARTRASAIVLVSSDSGVRGDVPLGAYSVSKAAVNMMGRMLAVDLAPQGIRVNVVCPGDTLPGMRYMGTLQEPEASAEDPARWTASPIGRFAEGREVAEVIAFLGDERSSFVDGVVMLVDGAAAAGHP